MTPHLEEALAEVKKLPPEDQDLLAAWILEKIASPDFKTEAEWEAEVDEKVLGVYTKTDGSIDFDKLDADTKIVDPDELYVESDEDIDA